LKIAAAGEDRSFLEAEQEARLRVAPETGLRPLVLPTMPFNEDNAARFVESLDRIPREEFDR
jgi:hypothetical protein